MKTTKIKFKIGEFSKLNRVTVFIRVAEINSFKQLGTSR